MADTNKPVALLSFIRGAETSRGYEDYFRGSKLSPPKPLTEMTVSEVRSWQKASVRAGSKSSAAGGYQIIGDTLDTLVRDMKLTGNEVFDDDMQDRMGMALLERRGFSAWQAGKLSDEAFRNNLAHEWAALPTAAGRSAYHGDGLNASTVNSNDLFGALRATRNGEQIDMSGITPGAQRYATGAGSSTTGAVGGGDITVGDISKSAGGADLSQINNQPLTSFRTVADDKAAEKAIDEMAPGLIDIGKYAVEEQWVAAAALRQLGKEEFTPVPGFQFSQELWDEVSKDIPDDQLEVFAEATSEAHARSLAATTRESLDRKMQLGLAGWTGIGAQLGAAILDPVSIAATAATEGTLGPVLYGAKLGKLKRALAFGGIAAAENMAMDAYLISQDPVRGWDGLAYSAAGGFLLGGAVGAYRASPVDGEVTGWLQGWMKKKDREAAAFDATPEVPDASVAGGSMGAAQVPGEVNLSAAEQVVEGAQNAPFSARPLGLKRIDMVGDLKQSPLGVVRKWAGLVDEDGVGNADGSVNMISAQEKSARLIRTSQTRVYKVFNPAFKAWAKEEGYGVTRWFDPSVRYKFSNEVGFAIRREIDATDNVHVRKAAAKIKEEYAQLLEYGKKQNIRGFQDIAANDLYLSRRHNIEAIDLMIREHGEQAVHALVAKALQRGNREWRNMHPSKAMGMEELSQGDATIMAKAYIKSIRDRKYGQFEMNQALSGHDMETLGRMLDDAGVSPDEAAKIADAVRFKRDAGDTGRITNAKHRLNLAEDTELDLFDPNTGKRSKITIEDMLVNDAEELFANYSASVYRAGQLEEAMSVFKVPDANGDMPAHAPSFETIKGYVAKEALDKGVSADDVKVVQRKMTTLYNAVKGVPQEEHISLHDHLRRLRSFNFIRVMGQVGVAQVAEFGQILGNGGVKAFIQNMPSFRNIIELARTGHISDDFLDECESIWGFGTDIIRHKSSVRLDDTSGGTFASRGGATKGQRLDFALEQGKAITATVSGMSHINRMLQRMNGRVLVQRFVTNAAGGRKINMKRFKALGIDEAMADRINGQINKYVKTQPGFIGKTVKSINIEKWDDVAAKEAFIDGVGRWAKRSVQENNPGNMPYFMTKEMGKTIGQFRSFMLSAYTKQLLSGMHHRDWETGSAFLASMFFGGMAYVGQTYANSIGRPDREDFLNERLSASSIAKASFQRAGVSTFIPALVDSGHMAFTGEAVFSYRSTDLASGLLGNPTVDLIDNAHRTFNGVVSSATRGDYEFSQQDWRTATSIVPWQNAFIIRNILASMGGSLPRYSQ